MFARLKLAAQFASAYVAPSVRSFGKHQPANFMPAL